MKTFTVQPLAQSQIHAAYPLIREAVPTLDLAAWSRFARLNADRRRAAHIGIMVAQRRSRPYPSGLFVYRKDADLQYGLVLTADHFVAIDIIDHRPVVSALTESLEALARRLACNAIRSIVRVGSTDVTPGLIGAGYRLEGAILCKQFDREAVSDARADFFRIPSEAKLAANA